VKLYQEERAGKPAVQPMAPVDEDDIANDPMFARAGDAGDDEATRH
jgi:hypothetical protein